MEKIANDAWAFLIKETQDKITLLPGEKTKKQFAKETGIPVRMARDVLENMVDDEKFTVRKVILDGKVTNVYKPISNTMPQSKHNQ